MLTNISDFVFFEVNYDWDDKKAVENSFLCWKTQLEDNFTKSSFLFFF